jgi:hypothetical protein
MGRHQAVLTGQVASISTGALSDTIQEFRDLTLKLATNLSAI